MTENQLRQKVVDIINAWIGATKGSAKHRIIRRFFPKGTNFDDITAAEVAQVEEWLANYPRRILDWKTPQMLYDEYMTVAA